MDGRMDWRMDVGALLDGLEVCEVEVHLKA